jgi:hypothetical protein
VQNDGVIVCFSNSSHIGWNLGYYLEPWRQTRRLLR